MPSTAAAPDQIRIQSIFNRLSDRYNLFNRLTSFGLDGYWRSKALKPLKTGMRVLDLGCGTGDLSLEVAKRLQGNGEVVGLDFSENMLAVARQCALKMGVFSENKTLRFEQRRAEDLPFEKEPYDLVLSAFVLRNIYENIDSILQGIYDSLKTGGEISLLDFTEPPNPFLKKMWQTYMNTVAAFYGKLLFGKDFPLFYMTDSAERFLKAPEFAQKLEQTGFKNITVKKFMSGIIVLYQAKKY